ncbi:MAG TPA: hypothetical protein VFA10_16775 [Ktedonobacteraceae bacterium]|nr:hypothetical protein [Ktedonobacteraceae bacterium]
MQQADTFPITIAMKDGKIRVISTLPPPLTTPLLRRIVQELAIPYQERFYAGEAAEEADGTPNRLFQTLEGIDADALCLLTGDGQFIFIPLAAEEMSETERYQRLMREKLLQYMR